MRELEWQSLQLHEHGLDAGYALWEKTGEHICGDACAIWRTKDRIVLALADGLGHGTSAAHAANMALQIIGDRLDWSCEQLFEECDRQLRDTRGVALSLAVVEPAAQRVTIAAVGNVRGMLLTSDIDRRLPGACGIVGAGYIGLVPESLSLAAGDVLVLYSDGLAELLPLRELLCNNDIPAVKMAEAALVRWASGSDDASMLVYRHGRGRACA